MIYLLLLFLSGMNAGIIITQYNRDTIIINILAMIACYMAFWLGRKDIIKYLD